MIQNCDYGTPSLVVRVKSFEGFKESGFLGETRILGLSLMVKINDTDKSVVRVKSSVGLLKGIWSSRNQN